MKIITVNIKKGGTGKSSISFNLAKWKADIQHKNTLLIDGDHSQNVSFSIPNLKESSIYDAFVGNEVEVTKVSEHLDFLKGSPLLEDGKLDIKSWDNNKMIFFMWIADNMELLQKYEYIIIDTHNDDSIVTANFLAAADTILAVTDTSRNGVRAWFELLQWIEELKTSVVDPITRKSYIDCEPYLLGNRVKHIGDMSKEFLEAAEQEDRYLGMVQEKALVAKSLSYNKSIFEMRQEMTNSVYNRYHKKFFENVESIFSKISNL